MTADLVIRNGHVVTPTGVVHGGLAVEGETIVAVDADARLPAARRALDARGRYVRPGLIDAHVHMASEEDASIEDGLRQKMPVETDGTLHGGVTTFGHFGEGHAQRWEALHTNSSIGGAFAGSAATASTSPSSTTHC